MVKGEESQQRGPRLTQGKTSLLKRASSGNSFRRSIRLKKTSSGEREKKKAEQSENEECE